MLTINLTEALAELNLLAQINMGPWLAEVGAHELKTIQQRIENTKASPDYIHWAAWSPRRFREREAKGNIGQGLLWDTGNLLGSLRFESSPTELVIGTDVAYAKELQEGRDNPSMMPGRPFVGWTDDAIGGALLLGETQSLEASAAAFIEGLTR
jgi:phage gpG-like protein